MEVHTVNLLCHPSFTVRKQEWHERCTELGVLLTLEFEMVIFDIGLNAQCPSASYFFKELVLIQR